MASKSQTHSRPSGSVIRRRIARRLPASRCLASLRAAFTSAGSPPSNGSSSDITMAPFFAWYHDCAHQPTSHYSSSATDHGVKGTLPTAELSLTHRLGTLRQRHTRRQGLLLGELVGPSLPLLNHFLLSRNDL